MDGYLCSGLAPRWEIFSVLYIYFIMVTFINYLFNYLPWTVSYLFLLAFYSPLVHFFGGGECKDPSHFLFSGLVYESFFVIYCQHTECILLFNNRKESCS